jgi:hypothetical protein
MDADSPAYCRQQAAAQRAEGAASPLARVRDRCEKAARAWDIMAERGEFAAKRRLGAARFAAVPAE